ncbi:hypothetical protein ACGFX4_13775 [Kitasatospora sp. NPDC048365]|uniref:hypothetical protein n=1 Tax=Kitasatospora sp. NPDC048365 TaxID=3364050 RepID=UPI00371D2B8B
MDLTPSGPLRRGLCAAAIAATAPYLTLKLLWLSGSTVGITDSTPTGATALWWLNLLTFGLDATAVALALAFVRPWGRRLPGGLVAFPMWVATGLLGPLMVALVLNIGAAAMLGAEPARPGADWLAPWVYLLVYGGFAVQAVALTAGFALYGRERWAALLGGRVGGMPGTATLPLQRTLAAAGAVLVLPALALHLAWLGGSDLALSATVAADLGRGGRIMSGVLALAAVGAAGSHLTLVFRLRPGGRVVPLLVAVWTAGGGLFCWGGWTFLATVLGGAGDAAHALPAAALLAGAAQVAAGLLLLVVGALALVERASAAADVESAR